MIPDSLIRQQLPHTLKEIVIPRLGAPIRGKVRDSYKLGDKRLLITSDRLSAFDRVLTTIPFKGQLLNAMAAHWFARTAKVLPNHLIAMPHPNVMLVREVEIIPVEVVVRGYLAGSAWRDYCAGRLVSGIALPPGLKKSARLERPIITPSTKASGGAHDEPISSAEVVARGLCEEQIWAQVCEKALELFALGTAEAGKNGLLLVDTKYEFGILSTAEDSRSLVLADEIHTQDSSRYWVAATYEERLAAEKDPQMLDKEFVRRWLMEQGYQGEGIPPEFSDDFRIATARRYIQAFEQITGATFAPRCGKLDAEIVASMEQYLG